MSHIKVKFRQGVMHICPVDGLGLMALRQFASTSMVTMGPKAFDVHLDIEEKDDKLYTDDPKPDPRRMP